MALIKAAKVSDIDTVSVLLQHQADVTLKDNGGSTALHYACLSGSRAVVKMLIESGGADMTAKNKYGSIPLHNAALLGRSKVVELLLDKRPADVNRVSIEFVGCV